MRRSLLASALCAGALATAAGSASAAIPHVVVPGDTLWSIAASHNLTTRYLAGFNGLPEDATVVLGTTINVPTSADFASAPAVAPATPSTAPGSAPTAASSDSSAPPPAGAYTVKPGDTLSALAARTGVRAEQIAGVNGLTLEGPLLAGTTIKLPPASVTAPGAAAPASQAIVPAADPAPTGTRVDSATVKHVAGHNGVDGSLAAAIAWQESGFNNATVSSANARGVMQIMPGTWDWVQRNLADRPLDPQSAVDNVHAGTLYLSSLLRETSGDPALAAAGYYQGLSSVRRIGMLPETRRYVANVMALRSRFAG